MKKNTPYPDGIPDLISNSKASISNSRARNKIPLQKYR